MCGVLSNEFSSRITAEFTLLLRSLISLDASKLNWTFIVIFFKNKIKSYFTSFPHPIVQIFSKRTLLCVVYLTLYYQMGFVT